MQPKRPVRVIKREERERARSAPAAVAPERQPESAESGERQLKRAVTGWVREHEDRSEEYRRIFSDLLQESGFRPSRA